MLNTLQQRLRSALSGAKLSADVDMSSFTSFRTGGRAKLMLDAQSGEEVCAAIRIAQELHAPYYVIGNASNLLVSDRGLDALVIRIGAGMSKVERLENGFEAQAGALLAQFAKATVAAGFMGLEWAEGIPGSVGGAVAMNAGAYGGEIAQVLREAVVIEEGETRRVAVREGDLGYRKSAFCAPARIVLAARFALAADDGGAAGRMHEYNRTRREKQPLQYPSAGSTFKRPPGHYAGGLIQQAGLKGMRVGGAQVSELHAGFLINAGGATSADVYLLIRLVQERVFEASGVRLEPEVRLLGEFD